MSRRLKYRRFLMVILCLNVAAVCTFGYREVKNLVPDTIYLEQGSEETLEEIIDNPLIFSEETIKASENGSYRIPTSILGVLPLKEVKIQVVDNRQVSVCGMPVGLYMETQGVLIVDTGEIVGQDGIPCEPAANIAKSGDYILQMDGEKISSKRELIEKIHACEGNSVTLLVRRNGEEVPLSIDPVLGEDQEYKLGIWVRDNTQGIGTMTYVENDGTYGALGHGISDIDTGELLDVSRGELYEAEIVSIMKGTKGNPGELSGYIDYDESRKIGSIDGNTEKGIFGQISGDGLSKLMLTPMEVGYKQDVVPGKAEIYVYLEGERRSYEVEITEIYRDKSDTNKAFAIQITDSDLLAATGGIVQGMSGSPVIQNGKFIGAVTYVFVNDSTKGYGIFAETMLEQNS